MMSPMKQIACCFAATLAVGGAHAAPITIVNGDFETVFQQGTTTPQAINVGAQSRNFGNTTLANGGQGGVAVTVPGWIGSSPGNFAHGIIRPAATEYTPPTSSNESIVGYIGGSNSFSQTLSATLQAGTYVLSFEVGDPASGSFNASAVPGTGALLTDGVALTPTVSVTPTPVAGTTFVTHTYTYVVPLGDSNLGDTLGVRISRGTNAFDRIDYDNVELDFTAIPEPASLALLGLSGLAMLTSRGRRTA